MTVAYEDAGDSMNILANALPGFRGVRAPLIAGYCWLLFSWLVVEPSLPVRNATEPLESLLELADVVGRLASAVVVSVGAYLLGVVSVSATDAMASALTRSVPLKTEARSRTQRVVRRLVGVLPKEVVAGLVLPAVRRVYLPRDWIESQVQSLRPTGVSRPDITQSLKDELEQQTSAAMDKRIIPEFQQELSDELDVPATLLIGDHPEAFAEADRLSAEGEFRIATALPLVAIAVLLTIKASLWWLLALPPLVALFAQGVRKRTESRSLIADAIRLEKVQSRAVRMFEAQVQELARHTQQTVAERLGSQQ